MKKCGICKLDKENVGRSGRCTPCNTQYMRQFREKNKDKIKKYHQSYDKNYYQENKSHVLEKKKEYYQNNKEDILSERKEHYQKNIQSKLIYNRKYYKTNRVHILNNAKSYYANNISKIRIYQNTYVKKRRANDFSFRLKIAISSNISFYLKTKSLSKNKASTIKHLQYSIQELKKHLESKFEPWMNWSNYGVYRKKVWNDNDQSTWTWQIDHIIPHSTFKYTNMKEQSFKDCWALNNLRPYSAKQNFLDGMNRVRH
jgi:hypothetical protein